MQTIKNTLLTASCTANTLHLELCKILLAYKRSIRPATAMSPAIAVFVRQINSRLDPLLIQNLITDILQQQMYVTTYTSISGVLAQ